MLFGIGDQRVQTNQCSRGIEPGAGVSFWSPYTSVFSLCVFRHKKRGILVHIKNKLKPLCLLGLIPLSVKRTCCFCLMISHETMEDAMGGARSGPPHQDNKAQGLSYPWKKVFMAMDIRERVQFKYWNENL